MPDALAVDAGSVAQLFSAFGGDEGPVRVCEGGFEGVEEVGGGGGMRELLDFPEDYDDAEPADVLKGVDADLGEPSSGDGAKIWDVIRHGVGWPGSVPGVFHEPGNL
jgi:hypothetical protein